MLGHHGSAAEVVDLIVVAGLDGFDNVHLAALPIAVPPQPQFRVATVTGMDEREPATLAWYTK
jgi:hypothetical protein